MRAADRGLIDAAQDSGCLISSTPKEQEARTHVCHYAGLSDRVSGTRLMAIMSINTGRYGEIRRSLIEAKLIGWSSRSVIQRRSMQDASVPYWHHATRLPRPKRGLLNPVTVILRMVIAVTSGIQGCTDLVSVHRLPVGLAFPARSSTRAEGWICGLSSSQVRVAPIGI